MKAWPLLSTLFAISSCVPLTDMQEHPQHAHHDHPVGADAQAPAQELSRAILGVWIFPQADPEVSPVVLSLNGNSTYERESEGAVFEKGRWSLQGNRLVLRPIQGASLNATVQIKSANELIWDAGGRSPMLLKRS